MVLADQKASALCKIKKVLMANAAYCKSLAYTLCSPRPAPRIKWVVLGVTVPSCDAMVLRRALAACPETGILRSIPQLEKKRVRLEVKLPGLQIEQVMHCSLVCVPSADLDTLTPWWPHRVRHGLTHEN